MGFGLAGIQIILQIDKDVFMTGYWVAALIFLTGVLLVNMLYNIQLMRFAGENGVAAYGTIMYANFFL